MRTLYIDIETLPQGAPEARRQGGGLPSAVMDAAGPPEEPERRQVPRSWRDPAKIAAKVAEIEAEHADRCAQAVRAHYEATWDRWAQGALRASEALVHTIGWTVDDGPVCSLSITDEPDDRALLAEWGRRLDGLGRLRIVAHNAEFDTGILWSRALHHHLDSLAGRIAAPHYRVVAARRAYQQVPEVLDTRDLWPVPRHRGELRLQTIAQVLGLAPGEDDDPIDGSEVLAAYLAGRDDEIAAHCRSDVRILRDVYLRLTRAWGI